MAKPLEDILGSGVYDTGEAGDSVNGPNKIAVRKYGEFAYAAEVELDFAEFTVWQMSDVMTGPMALTLLNCESGVDGEVWVKQNEDGNKLITGITVTGRITKISRDVSSALNNSNFKLPNAVTEMTVKNRTIAGVDETRITLDTNKDFVAPTQGSSLSIIFGDILALEFDPASLDGDSLVDDAMDKLSCQVTGHSIIAENADTRPAYDTVDDDYGDHPSIRTTSTGTDGLRSDGPHATPLLAEGSSPYVAWLGRLFTGSLVPLDGIFSLCSDASLTTYLLIRASNENYKFSLAVNGVTRELDFTPTSGVHLYEFIYNGVDGIDLYIDYEYVESIVVDPLGADVRKVSLGQRMDDTGHANVSHGYLIACHETPSPSQRVAAIPFWQDHGAPINVAITGALHLAGQSNALFYTPTELITASIPGFSAWQKTAEGSTSVAVDWQQGSELYVALRDKIIADADKTNIVVRWIQGEEDSRHADMAAAYGANMTQFATDLEADTGRSDILWVINYLHADLESPPHLYRTDVNTGMDAFLASRPSRVIILDPSPFPLAEDMTHWSDVAKAEMMELTSDAVLDYYG